MKRLPLSDALLAHSVPALGTDAALLRVAAIKSCAALDHAEIGEAALNGRSAVLYAIARRRTELREIATAKGAKGGAA